MLRKTHIRRPFAVSLMLLGAAMIFLALETWTGTVVLVLGLVVELLGIALNRKA
ncbi:MAG: hypothetical protein HZB95_00680 [Nitrosomonadales bacterium]|nr:hypothetical protein [Nitrosomonadales bacterium]